MGRGLFGGIEEEDAVDIIGLVLIDSVAAYSDFVKFDVSKSSRSGITQALDLPGSLPADAPDDDEADVSEVLGRVGPQPGRDGCGFDGGDA